MIASKTLGIRKGEVTPKSDKPVQVVPIIRTGLEDRLSAHYFIKDGEGEFQEVRKNDVEGKKYKSTYRDNLGRDIRTERYDEKGILTHMQLFGYDGSGEVKTIDYYDPAFSHRRILRDVGTPTAFYEDYDSNGELIRKYKL